MTVRDTGPGDTGTGDARVDVTMQPDVQPDVQKRDDGVPDVAPDVAPDESPDADGGGCMAPQVVCMGVCTDTQSDPNNCGACGTACPMGQLCTAGMCTCPMGQSRCGTSCVNTQTDPMNCGACGMACTGGQLCIGGMCTVMCDPPRMRCTVGGMPACIDTQSDLANCGACGNACPAGTTCEMGMCVCPAGQTRCGTSCVDTSSDSNNCGMCGRTCASTEACMGGTCMSTCRAPSMMCGAMCVNVTSDTNNCGTCGTVCPTGANGAAACTGGMCRLNCNPGFANCDGSAGNGCEVNTNTSVTNCGACGTVCNAGPNATPTCSSGACGIACLPGFGNCDGNLANGCETNLNTTATSCGACGRACPAGQACVAAMCTTCVPPNTMCGAMCANLQNSPTNCGACGNVCPARANASTSCTGGTCGFACNAGFANCDGMAANGCEVNTTNTVAHCGACNNACPPRANASATCTAGSCGFTCNPGFGNCDGNALNGCETNLNTTPGNCGACGRVCATPPNGTATCAAGACGVACSSGFGNCDGNVTNGCETALNTSVTNCGTCGRVCPTGPNATAACNAGACTLVCNSGLGNCDGNTINGCETNIRTNTANCGACGRVCPAGNTCVEGACVRPQAGGEECTSAIFLGTLSPGNTLAVSGSTSGRTNSASSCTGAPDVWYSFNVSTRSIVYADTYGSSYDTYLGFRATCASPNVGCADDSCGSLQSQTTTIFDPGIHYVQVDGFSTASGAFVLRLQALPVSGVSAGTLGVGNFSITASTVGAPTRAFSCGGASQPERWYQWLTCPADRGGILTATTCTNASYDSTLEARDGNAVGATCNDDDPSCTGFGNRSRISRSVPFGAGIHILSLGGFGGASGTATITGTRP